ncbi:MAG TPA: alpha/beta fold hydrolase [Thermoanaerobaculia bacterium]|nr:alpha/beta fold hydrolase [Thermoanaerobaculia bacterium]
MNQRAPRKSSHRRRRLRPLWTLLGLTALGVVATWLSSRRIEPLEGWDELLDGEDGAGGAGRAAAAHRDHPFPPTSLRVDGPAGALHVEDGGTGGLPVVFVHGLAGSAGQWAAQLAHLRRHRRALAVDLRGHGRSDPAGDGVYGVEDLAGDVAAVADELGLERFVLAGHSLGASVASELAAREPERVAGLLLVDPNGDQTRVPRREISDFLATVAADPEAEVRWYFKQVLTGAAPGTAERVLADLEATPPEVLVGALEASSAHSPVPALEAYRGPVLAVVSDMNTLPYSLPNLLPKLPVRLMAGTSHWLMLDRPDELSELLDRFLATLSAGSPAAPAPHRPQRPPPRGPL